MVKKQKGLTILGINKKMTETHILIGCNREFCCMENDLQSGKLCPDLKPERILLPDNQSLLSFINMLEEKSPLTACHLGYPRYRTATELPNWE
jgi:hypothetical protein